MEKQFKTKKTGYFPVFFVLDKHNRQRTGYSTSQLSAFSVVISFPAARAFFPAIIKL